MLAGPVCVGALARREPLSPRLPPLAARACPQLDRGEWHPKPPPQEATARELATRGSQEFRGKSKLFKN